MSERCARRRIQSVSASDATTLRCLLHARLAIGLIGRGDVVLSARIAVSTREIFAAPELTRHSESAKMAVFSEGYGGNDLHLVVAARFPEVAACVAALSCAAPAEMPEKRLDLLLAR